MFEPINGVELSANEWTLIADYSAGPDRPGVVMVVNDATSAEPVAMLADGTHRPATGEAVAPGAEDHAVFIAPGGEAVIRGLGAQGQGTIFRVWARSADAVVHVYPETL